MADQAHMDAIAQQFVCQPCDSAECQDENCGNADAETIHFSDVVYSFANYAKDSYEDARHFPDMYERMSPEDRALLGMMPHELKQLRQSTIAAVQMNQQFLDWCVSVFVFFVS